MGILYISEYSNYGAIGFTVVRAPVLVKQTVSFSTATSSNVFNTNTRIIRLHTDSICSFEIGVNPTATTTSARMVAGQTEYFEIPDQLGFSISVISNI